MSFQSEMKQMAADAVKLAYRPAQEYLAATGAYIVFNITGPVLITLLGGRTTGAAVGATTVRYTINGINVDAAVIAINGALGLVHLSCLNVAGTLVQAAGIPMTDALLHSKGFVSGIQPAGAVGTIVATFATATSVEIDIFCLYRRLSPTSQINVA